MNISELSSLVGKNTSSAEAQELFRAFPHLQASVEDFAPDENLPPEHYLTDQSMGIQLRHSVSGEIEVIFLMGEGKDQFSQYRGTLGENLSFSSTPQDVVRQLGQPTEHLPLRKVILFGTVGETVRYDYANHSLHFQFSTVGHGIEQITLSIPRATPGRNG